MEVQKVLQNEPRNLTMELQTWRQKCEHQATLISRLEEENESLRTERKTYMEKLKEKRGELASFQGILDDAASEIADLKRALIRAQDSASQNHRDVSQRPSLQIPLTPPPSASTILHTDVTANDNEIQYLGSSGMEDKSEACAEVNPSERDLAHTPIRLDAAQYTEMSILTLFKKKTKVDPKRQSTPRMVPFVSLPPRPSSIKRELPHTGRGEKQTTIDVSFRSLKRRRVEETATGNGVKVPSHEFKIPLPRPTTSMVVTSRPNISPVTANANTSPFTSPSGSSKPKIKLTLHPPKDQVKPEMKPKPKTEAFIIPPFVVSEHLKTCKPFHINPPPHEVYVPRRFIRATYGGNDRLLVQKIKSHRNPSGPIERRIMFPMFDMNPSMPAKPGEPGLMYASRLDLTEDSPHSLFASDIGNKRAVWRYIGEYESTVCSKMSASLFRGQRPEVKKAWGTQIRDGKQWDIYVAMRARIALRKAKQGVTADKVDEEMVKIKNNNGRPVSIEDIISAFENGAEGIDIIKMQCVGYDHTFADDVETKFDIWNTPAARTERQLLKGKRQAIRRHRGSEVDDGSVLGGGSDVPSQHLDFENRDSLSRNARGPITSIANRPTSNDGAFESDLTEYDYESSFSVN
ncbi:hypothetical protein BDZ94DRAFT_1299267 [Collybia nuda]|uniref:DUF6697 domain-containing protein n=1 Tax=Collybia nuda TaxID=64659 RepID=A0A9P5Y154_9AGAR|nr:hypothetical protein BDZ94DRAFT_1299267 [Collybia nuda]